MKGHSIQQIAELRNLSSETIEGHLAFYLQRGKIAITQLMETPKVVAIMNAIDKTMSPSMTPVKEMLGDAFTYGQIRLVKSHRDWVQSSGNRDTITSVHTESMVSDNKKR
ncbi:MAG TPA: helix-turn-helix domain-containing protein [Chryseolinea sp.]